MGKPTGFLEYLRELPLDRFALERIRDWNEFHLHLDEKKLREQGARCMDCGIPFCHKGCPLGNIIPDWNDFVYRGRWREAIERLHSTNNFPEFTGRVCPAPCEEACTLRINDDPVGIKSIEHAIIDKAWEEGWVTPQAPSHKTGKKVAVVGSGPAGLTAAGELAKLGHDVTVFEAFHAPGGVLIYGIPEFRLPKDIVQAEVDRLKEMGVKIEPNVIVGKTYTLPELRERYDAVFIAVGAGLPVFMQIPGENLKGVYSANESLTRVNLMGAWTPDSDTPILHGRRVVVVGGGMGDGPGAGAVAVTPSGRPARPGRLIRFSREPVEYTMAA